MATSSSALQLVPKLQGSHNFLAWKTPCIAVLEANNVWKFVEGDPTPPTQNDDKKAYVFKEHLEKFLTKSKLACTIILCTCSSPIQLTLAKAKTTKECWAKIHETYEALGLVHQLDL
jgi:hypothetical protein